VLAAALAEFAARGYAAVSIEDVASRAGTTKGAVYYYFHDKEDLAAALQADLWGRLGDVAAASFDAEGSANANLKETFRVFLSALGDLPEARFFLRDGWAVPALDAAGRAIQDAAVSPVRRVLQRGIDRGEVPVIDADAAAHVLLGAYAEATLHVLATGDAAPAATVIDRIIDGLVPPASASS